MAVFSHSLSVSIPVAVSLFIQSIQMKTSNPSWAPRWWEQDKINWHYTEYVWLMMWNELKSQCWNHGGVPMQMFWIHVSN